MVSFIGHDEAANTSTTQPVEEIPLQDLPELLGVTGGVNPSEDRSCSSVESESDSAQQKQRNVRLIQESVSQHLPKPPSDLDQNLQQHLVNVQKTVCNELMRLSPRLKKMGLIECLIDSYYCQTLDHISDLFKNVQSCKKSFELMKWILHPYLRYVSHLCILHPTVYLPLLILYFNCAYSHTHMDMCPYVHVAPGHPRPEVNDRLCGRVI